MTDQQLPLFKSFAGDYMAYAHLPQTLKDAHRRIAQLEAQIAHLEIKYGIVRHTLDRLNGVDRCKHSSSAA